MNKKDSPKQPAQSEPTGKQPATDLVRQRINDLYSKHDTNPPGTKDQASLLQKFWKLHGDADDHHSAWEQFYAQLPDDQKQQLWNEYHQTQFSVTNTIKHEDPDPSTLPVKQVDSSANEPDTSPVQPPATEQASKPAPKAPTEQPAPAPEPVVATPVNHAAAAPGTPSEAAPGTEEKGGTGPQQPSVLAQKRKKVYQTFHIPGSEEPEPEVAPKKEAPVPSLAIPATEDHPALKAHLAKETPKEKVSTVADTKQQILDNLKTSPKKGFARFKKHRGPFFSALITMSLIFALNYNQVAIATVKKYVSPGDSISSPIIIDPNVDIAIGDENKIIIPKINVDVPVVYDITSYKDSDIQEGLERGVVHYGETPHPGQPGNNVIVGHSSSNFFNSGKYKFAFVLLDRLEINDTFIIHYEGTRYVYRINNKQVIQPDDFSLIQPTATPTTTLITCSPPGTNWQRLVIQAEQISPDPSAIPAPISNVSPDKDEATVVPGNAPSLWQRFTDWVF